MIERRLIECGSEHKDAASIHLELDRFKQFSGRMLSDDDYFSILVDVTFYSGFRAATVTSKLPVIRRHFPGWKVVAAYSEADVNAISADPAMISHERKIRGCIKNAKVFAALIEEHCSIRSYIDSFAPAASFENLLLLKEALEALLDYLGGITVYHFMTEIGLPVLKPDRVICRIFTRLGLLENESQLLKAVLQGKKFAEATGHPIRYIDRVLAAYGQVRSDELGVTQGICLKDPRCGACAVSAYCRFANLSSPRGLV